MTRTLPDEILLKIFNDIDRTDLLNCQQVCRSWYSPAHVILLKEVELTSYRAIEQFVAAFEHNSNKSYYNAVKSITIGQTASEQQQSITIERGSIDKLFCRFPNLKDIVLHHLNLIENFDEELSEKILLCCPKLDRFEITDFGEDPELYNHLVKVQPLLTNMQLPEEVYTPEEGNLAQFITQFPRLQSILCEESEISSLGTVLPILEQLPNVNRLHLALEEDTEENFGEMHLSTTRIPRDLMTKKLSNITSLYIHAYTDINNSLQFVYEYFTSLKFFEMRSDLCDMGQDEQRTFCENTSNIITSMKGDCSVNFRYVNFTSLSSAFPSLVQNMFQNVATIHKQSTGRVLELAVASYSFLDPHKAQVALQSVQSPFSRKIHITVDQDFDLHTSNIFQQGTAPMNEVDAFKLTFSSGHYLSSISIHIGTYFWLLSSMRFAKKVELDVPFFFDDKHDYHLPAFLPLQAKELTFTAIGCTSMQSLLNCCRMLYREVKLLNFRNFCGDQRKHSGEFLLDLQDYSVDKVTLDVEPVVVKLKEQQRKFFVLEVETQENGERRLYKVSPDLSCCKSINNSDLKEFRRPRHYLRLRIFITCLKQIELYVREDKDIPSLSIMFDNSE